MRFVAISDTHGRQGQYLTVPDGDVFIHAGDFTRMGNEWEVQAFAYWLAQLPHRHKIVVAGNHDHAFDPAFTNLIGVREAEQRLADVGATYLHDSGVVLDGIPIWGSPYQPTYGRNWAFNRDIGPDLKIHWDLIPAGTQVLVTHGPPLGHGDFVPRGVHAGCPDLLAALSRVRPVYHVFGHVHEGHGATVEPQSGTHCLNVSMFSVSGGGPYNPCTVFDLPGGG